jgi:Methane oxygenase PmoA
MSHLAFAQSWDDRIDIYQADGATIAGYCFGPELPKPCFHPLATGDGHVITGFQMSDHVWHRGLWFTIKYINQSNFWEERPPFGVQVTRSQPKCELVDAQTVRLEHELQWTAEATGAVLDERRTISFHVQADGVRRIDWVSSLTPLQDLVLDRTPYTTWGGYGGLAFRAARQVHGTSCLLPDGQSVNAIIGQPHPWSLVRGIVDGRPDAKISIGMIDHPGNPRSPQPWYCKTGNSYDLMNAAFLFNEPMNVARGEKLEFRYRVLYRDGWWEADEFSRLADEFRK